MQDDNMKLKSLEEENFKLGGRIKEEDDQRLYLEAYSRRENLKFKKHSRGRHERRRYGIGATLFP